jgi:hypothetical protein
MATAASGNEENDPWKCETTTAISRNHRIYSNKGAIHEGGDILEELHLVSQHFNC